MLGPEFLVRFEKHPKAVSGTLRGRFRAREVFGPFEKRTPGLKFTKFVGKSMQEEERKIGQILLST